VVALKPDAPDGWRRRGEVRAKQRDWQKAIDDFSEAVKLYQALKTPTAGDSFGLRNALLGRADAHAELGQWAAAADDIPQAFELLRGGVVVSYQYKLALLRMQLGDPDGYRKARDRLLRISDANLLASPDQAYPTAWAAVLCPDALPDPDRPVRLARQLVSRSPESDAHARLLGAALLRAGQAEEAVKELTRAATLQERAPATWLLLALAHHRLGHADQARQGLARALAEIDRLAQPGSGDHAPWDERLLVQFLRREAEERINAPAGKPPPGR
jgi:tetratricopeptide (TPR) repeat protein